MLPCPRVPACLPPCPPNSGLQHLFFTWPATSLCPDYVIWWGLAHHSPCPLTSHPTHSSGQRQWLHSHAPRVRRPGRHSLSSVESQSWVDPAWQGHGTRTEGPPGLPAPHPWSQHLCGWAGRVHELPPTKGFSRFCSGSYHWP